MLDKTLKMLYAINCKGNAWISSIVKSNPIHTELNPSFLGGEHATSMVFYRSAGYE